MTCDFKKIEESNGNLHSLGLLNNNEVLKSKINKFHPSVDYLNNLCSFESSRPSNLIACHVSQRCSGSFCGYFALQ